MNDKSVNRIRNENTAHIYACEMWYAGKGMWFSSIFQWCSPIHLLCIKIALIVGKTADSRAIGHLWSVRSGSVGLRVDQWWTFRGWLICHYLWLFSFYLHYRSTMCLLLPSPIYHSERRGRLFRFLGILDAVSVDWNETKGCQLICMHSGNEARDISNRTDFIDI